MAPVPALSNSLRKETTVIADLPTAHKRSAAKLRILIVDDSVVVRRILTHTLSEEFEILGYAPSAEIALQKIKQLDPELVVLDVHMPGMSGIEALPMLRDRAPHLRVLFFSGSLPEDIRDHMDGMTAYLAKPSEDASLGDSVQTIRQQFREKIQVLFPGRMRLCSSETVQREVSTRRGKAPREVLAIGVSTGGPTALTSVLQGLPRNFHLPIVIVQHMPPVFTKLLADRIRTVTGLDIVEAADGMYLESGKAFLAPGNYHMRLVREGVSVRIRLDQGPMECSCRPSVDVLFRSVADVYGGTTIATVLTGMGQDGLRGAQELHRAGAHIIVQDEASSVVWGMPGAIAQAQLAHEVLDIDKIADAIQWQSGRKQNAGAA
jgi:two-component system chemotaxis response regulator CheB